MEKFYTINELALMTGLTTRTLRNYLQMNVLTGEKVNGAWQFTEEDISEFLANPSVQPSIQAKKNAVVFDFLADRKKKTNEICFVLDVNVSAEEAEEISGFFCEKINQLGGNSRIRFSFERNGESVRVMLTGEEIQVKQLLEEYYQK
ncbi:MAG: helix-turn-helix domain-containing protein [Lachnospiraceae bacterium]|nr:helix-turn-helix domain-containing protein [Lachnospiraceae bacterium]